jgi:hypothetical protein
MLENTVKSQRLKAYIKTASELDHKQIQLDKNGDCLTKFLRDLDVGFSDPGFDL